MNGAALLKYLSDGQAHSGVRLAQSLKISRSAVWKSIERLRRHGIDIRAHSRAGYQLDAPVELLDAKRIRAGTLPAMRAKLDTLEVRFEVGSTNSVLLEAGPPPAGKARVCLSELQTQGRGRRGRPWISAFGHSLMISISWNFAEAPRDLPALSLAAGVAVVRALEKLGARQLGLKWPNDIWCDGKKLGGVLIEMRAEGSGPVFMVLGLGLNVSMPKRLENMIERAGAQPAWLAQCMASDPSPTAAKSRDAELRDPRVSRNAVAASVLEQLLEMFANYSRHGFAMYREAWSTLDVLQNRPALLRIEHEELLGTARGVDGAGHLLLDAQGQRRTIVSGDVSLRSRAG